MRPAPSAGLAASSQAHGPALLVTRLGDCPAFWHKDASFIAVTEDVIEELYERVRTRSPQMQEIRSGGIIASAAGTVASRDDERLHDTLLESDPHTARSMLVPRQTGCIGVIRRLICLLFAVAIVAAGLAESSLILVILASTIVTLALTSTGEVEAGQPVRPWRELLEPSTWSLPKLPPAALTVGGLALGLCLLSIVLAPTDTFSLFSAASWALVCAAVVALGLLMDRITLAELRAGIRAAFARRNREEVGAVAAITLVAFGLRIYQLDTVPLMFHGDEGIVGQMALRILDGQRPPLLAVDAEWPQAYVYTYLEALSMWLFGANVFGLRVLGVVFGTLGVPVVYALGRVGWGPVAGAIAAWLFAVSHLQIHYSRLGTFVIESVPLMALVLLLLALAHERGQTRCYDEPTCAAASPRRGLWTLLLLAGLTCGFAQYFYYGSRVIPIVTLPLLLLLWRGRRIETWHAGAFGFGLFVIVAPLGAHFLEYPGRFTGRLAEVSIFQDSYVRQIVGEGASLPTALPSLLAVQTSRTLNLFAGGGDQGGFYSGNTPAFDSITAALIWLGLGAALTRPWRYHESTVLLWFGLGLIFSSVLTLGAHSGQRILIVTAAGFLLGGVFVARVLELLRGLPAGRIDWLALPAGTTLALWLLAANVSIYFFDYAPRGEFAEHAEAAREVVKAGDRFHVFFLTEPHFDPNHGAIRFIARDRQITSLKHAGDFRMPPADGRDIMLIVLESRRDDLLAIQAQLPGGTERHVITPNGRHLLTVYEAPRPG